VHTGCVDLLNEIKIPKIRNKIKRKRKIIKKIIHE